MSNEKLRILQMIKDGTVTPEEGLSLIQALESAGPRAGIMTRSGSDSKQEPEECCEFEGIKSGKKKAKFLLIKVDDSESGKNVNIKIPIALAKFAGKFIPKEARSEMQAQGVDIDLDKLLGLLENECCENLLEVEEGGKKIVKICCE